MIIIKRPISDPCKRHKRETNYVSYSQYSEAKDLRIKKGERQTQCQDCGRWYFKDEF